MKLAVLSVLAMLSVSTMASNTKVVYGDDDRVLVENSTNENFITWASATAAMIPNKDIRFPKIDDKYPETVKLFGITLKEDRNLCEGERFSEQLSLANCSGFLVEKDGAQYVVTAGHCMTGAKDCNSNSWAFGYTSTNVTVDKPYLNVENVYKCVEIMSTKLSRASQNDFAVIKLDRKVEGITPLKFRTEGKVSKDIELVVIGHPSGLPTIVDDSGTIRRNENEFYFQANLDTFGGNSGSAVLDAETGLIEGILVRGEDDYEYVSTDEGQYCNKVKLCEEDKCRGEDVTRITNIEFLTGVPGPVEVEEAGYDEEFDPFILHPWSVPYSGNPWENPLDEPWNDFGENLFN